MALFASILSTPVSASVPIGRRLINGRSHSRLFASLSPSESSPSTPATASSNNETAVSSRTPPSKPFAESSRQHDPSFNYARANPAGDSPLGFFRPIESNIERVNHIFSVCFTWFTALFMWYRWVFLVFFPFFFPVFHFLLVNYEL